MASSLHRILLLTAFVLFAVPAMEAVFATPASTVQGDVLEALISGDDEDRPFRLSAPHPNPFASATQFELVVDEAVELSVTVFDALGREVVRLHAGHLEPGTYPLSFDGEGLPTGLYVVRAMDDHGAIATRSVALVR